MVNNVKWTAKFIASHDSHLTRKQTGPDSPEGRVSAPGNGRFNPGQRHTKVVKNGTSCSSLGTQTYEVDVLHGG